MGNTIKRLFFLHIPKTGGTTFYDIIYENYKYRAIAKARRTFPIESVNNICPLSIEKKKKVQVVMGHILYGMHMHFPGGYTYITFLRDPIKRVLSLYNHIMTDPSHPLNSKAVDCGSLRSFIEEDFNSLSSNDQVRRISGCVDEEIGKKHFDIAKKNLCSQFAFVGITELYDESLVLLRLCFPQWSRYNFIRRNIGKSIDKQDRGVGGADILNVIQERNIWDVKLYEFARSKLMKSIESYGASFSKDLENFREENKSFANHGYIARIPSSFYIKIRNKMGKMGIGEHYFTLQR